MFSSYILFSGYRDVAECPSLGNWPTARVTTVRSSPESGGSTQSQTELASRNLVESPNLM